MQSEQEQELQLSLDEHLVSHSILAPSKIKQSKYTSVSSTQFIWHLVDLERQNQILFINAAVKFRFSY